MKVAGTINLIRCSRYLSPMACGKKKSSCGSKTKKKKSKK